jgi:hypothetical protein
LSFARTLQSGAKAFAIWDSVVGNSEFLLSPDDFEE